MKMSGKFSKSLNVTAVLAVAAITIVAASEGSKWIGTFYVKGRVGLKWQAMDGISEYVIYHKAGGGEFEKFASSDKTQHFDTDLTPGEIYAV